jgi:hypothetical protein
LCGYVTEKEREMSKRRALEKEMKWIEKMAIKQQDRNRWGCTTSRIHFTHSLKATWFWF